MAYDVEQVTFWSSSFSTERLEEAVSSTATFVIEDGGVIVGFANLISGEGGRAELDLVYVDPDFSGRGVARRAIEAVEAEARHRDAPGLWVDASLLAAPVFEHLGYVVVERYEKVRGPVSFPNTWLRKPLT